jgi:hypothetical protein
MANNNALLIKLGVLTVALVVLWRVSKPFRDGLETAKQSLDNVSKATGEVLSDVTASLNGHEPAQLTTARFFLFDKYVNTDQSINRDWRKTMIKSHNGIEALFKEILDPKARLKPKYQYLINGEVSAKTVFGEQA